MCWTENRCKAWYVTPWRNYPSEDCLPLCMGHREHLKWLFDRTGQRGRREPAEKTRTDTCCFIQKAIRDFLKVRTSYDVLPLSFRLIILNTDLLVKKSLNILLQNGTLLTSLIMLANQADKVGIVSAPLWDSHTSTFAGLLTTSDYINVIQYYWQNPDALGQIDQFRLSSLRGIATSK